MEENQVFSEKAYGVEKGTTTTGEILEIENKATKEQDKYIVLDTIDIQENGMQAVSVAKVEDKYKLKEDEDLKRVSGYPTSVIKKDITIAYAGTNVADIMDIRTDLLEIAGNIKPNGGTFHSAINYAIDIEKKYPDYKISTTGHSLGGAEAIYVAVHRNYDKAFTFSAGGAGLSDEEIKNYKGTIINLYDTSDIVTKNWWAGGQDRIPFISIGIDYAGWSLMGHALDRFKTDSYGNYIDKNGKIVIYAEQNGELSAEQEWLIKSLLTNQEKMTAMIREDNPHALNSGEYERLKKESAWLQAQLESLEKLSQLRQKFTSSGGGLSKSEEIYLDDSQALTILKLVSSQYEESMERMIKTYQEAISELEDTWQEGLALTRSLTPDLSEYEMLEAMSQVGCTENQMLDVPREEYQEKILKVRAMNEKFTRLIKEITAKIDELVQRDKELAQQFT